MSIVGVVDVLRGKPRNPVGPDGRMALSDHFRELRARLIRSALILVILFFVAIFFYDQLLELVQHPYNEAQQQLRGTTAPVSSQVVHDATGGLLLQMKLCGVVALIAASPYWLYQIWAFILPGLHPNEKKYTRMFAAVAGPLFIGGVALGYYVLPKGLEVLISFMPNGVTNLVDFGALLLLPDADAADLRDRDGDPAVRGPAQPRRRRRPDARSAEHRPWIVIGTMVFAAVATPSTDPFSMLMLAIPMLILFAISEVIARVPDRIRGRGAHTRPTDQWADDEVSPL